MDYTWVNLQVVLIYLDVHDLFIKTETVLGHKNLHLNKKKNKDPRNDYN